MASLSGSSLSAAGLGLSGKLSNSGCRRAYRSTKPSPAKISACWHSKDEVTARLVIARAAPVSAEIATGSPRPRPAAPSPAGPAASSCAGQLVPNNEMSSEPADTHPRLPASQPCLATGTMVAWVRFLSHLTSSSSRGVGSPCALRRRSSQLHHLLARAASAVRRTCRRTA